MRRLTLLLSGALAFCGPRLRAQSPPVAPQRGESYEKAVETACHNCYERGRFPSLLGALERTRSVEIDFYPGSRKAGKLDVAVRHWPVFLLSENDNNCAPGKLDLPGLPLEDCLRLLASRVRPADPPLTVYLDRKRAWQDGTREIEALDAALVRIFGPRLFTPRELRGSDSTLRAAVANNAWSRARLQGRVIVVLTGGALKAKWGGNAGLNRYAAARGDDAAMFVAPVIETEQDVAGTGPGIKPGIADRIVFQNLEYGTKQLGLVARIRALHLVGRMYAGDADVCGMVARQVPRIALYDPPHLIPDCATAPGKELAMKGSRRK